MKSLILRFFLPISIAVLSSVAASADDYAYLVANLNPASFGVVDLTTGVFTECLKLTINLNGLAAGPDHQLYGTSFASGLIYRINALTGTATPIGTGGAFFDGLGSTTTGLYGFSHDNKKQKEYVYAVDYQTGAATLIGSLRISSAKLARGISTNSRSLKIENDRTLYSVKLATGKAKEIGLGDQGEFGALAEVRGILYGASDDPLSVYKIDPHTGAVTPVASLSGGSIGVLWGMVPIKAQHILPENMCLAHKIF